MYVTSHSTVTDILLPTFLSLQLTSIQTQMQSKGGAETAVGSSSVAASALPIEEAQKRLGGKGHERVAVNALTRRHVVTSLHLVLSRLF